MKPNTLIIEAWHQAARSLGHERGSRHRRALEGVDRQPEPFPVSPLSGEWAGESLPELFHDITGQDYGQWMIADENLTREVLDAYEEAYEDSYYGE